MSQTPHHPALDQTSIPATLNALMPAWLQRATPEQRQTLADALRARHIGESPFLAFQAITQAHEFARLRLRDALSQRFGVTCDPLRDTFIAVTRELIVRPQFPSGVAHTELSVRRESLLAAAMQNFTADMLVPSLLQAGSMLRAASGAELRGISAHAFIRLCRALDLGGAYQQHLAEKFDVTTQRRFARRDEAALQLLGLSQHLRGTLTAAQWALVQQANHADVTATALRWADWLLEGSLVLQRRGSPELLVWLPGDKGAELYGFEDFAACQRALDRRLDEGGFRAWLLDRVGLLERQSASQLLAQSPSGQWTQSAPWPAGALWSERIAGRVKRLRLTARQVLVPTADADERVRAQRRARWEALGMDVLGLAGLFVPVLGGVLLIGAATEVVAEFYHGYQDWGQGRHRAAIEHIEQALLSIGETVVIGAGAAVIGKVVDSWRIVRLAEGEPRLWSATLSDYRVDTPPLAVVRRNTPVVYQGKHYLELDGHVVQVGMAPTGEWHIVHPRRPAAYRPLLEHDDHGGWRLAANAALEGDRLDLGGVTQRLTGPQRSTLERIMGLDDAALLALQKGGPLAARVRYWGQRVAGDTVMPSPGPAVQRLCDAFPALPSTIAQDLLDMLPRPLFQAFMRDGGMPLELAQGVQVTLRGLRVERAVQGLLDPQALRPETLQLVLAIAEDAADRPRGSLAIVSVDGTRLAGPAQARDTLTLPQASLDPTVFQTLAGGLPQDCWQGLGVRGRDGEALRQAVLARVPETFDARAALMGVPRTALRWPSRMVDGRIGYRLSGRGRIDAAHPSAFGQLRVLFPDITRAEASTLLADLSDQGLIVERYVRERKLALAQLEHELGTWEQAPMLTSETLERRRWCSQQLLRAWRRQSGRYRLTDGRVGFRLDLDDAQLETLPPLSPVAGFEHITDLRLARLGLHDVPEGFLTSFAGLRRLDLSHNELVGIPRLAGATAFEGLDLTNNRLSLTDLDIRRLASLPRLRVLNLADNEILVAPDLARLPHVERVILRNNALRQFPEGLELRPRLELMDLRDNQIFDLPPDIGRFRPRHMRRILLDGNPLTVRSRSALLTLQREQGFARQWSGPRSDSSVSGYGPWMHGTEESAEHLRLWSQFSELEGWAPLSGLLDELTRTAEFDSQPSWLRARVWALLHDCQEDSHLRRLVFDLAATPTTCADSAAEQFSQLELAVRVAKAEQGDGSVADSAALIKLAHGLHRQELLEQFVRGDLLARRAAAPTIVLDELEVGLAYRIGLADELGLPATPKGMLFEALAEVTEADLARARVQVLEEEAGQWRGFLEQREFWQAHLRRRHPDRFERVYLDAAQQADALYERREALDSAGYRDQMQAIGVARERVEAGLFSELTTLELSDPASSD